MKKTIIILVLMMALMSCQSLKDEWEREATEEWEREAITDVYHGRQSKELEKGGKK